MADGKIKKQDLLTDEAIAQFKILTDAVLDSAKSLDSLIDARGRLSNSAKENEAIEKIARNYTTNSKILYTC